ncbi:MAG: hypothetical protein A2Y64_00915 [Candidatus Coatesbacteria bacterium RBG_13_66_14]|uniref:Uncharacterized protein n=1 Tax=Candidatus Coatesbacteria bacterium RBG_13_66_14 TaxID=1817816 RepID=A0A1F5F5H4_9BACT|nr:MAG: hypothetical protein A2Y64_00915 [Candidatus Coatesbacteria bacterium RBG_13_66_14]
MPNVIRPEDIAPYPWRAGRVLIRILGALCLGGGMLTALSLTLEPGLAWFDRPPLGLSTWLYALYGLWSLNLCLAGAGLLLVKGWGRWLGAAAGLFITAVSVYPLAYNSLAGEKEWAWAAAAVAGILLAYSLLMPLRPAFGPTPPKRQGA